MVRINVDEDKIKLGFLFHQLKRHERRLKSVGAGSVIRHVDGGFFKRLPIPLMDDVEQNKIAEILDWSDSAIVAARESVAKAERLHDGLMQQMLIGRLKSDGTKRQDGDFNTDERIGLFPKGWKVRKLRQIVRLRNGKANITSNLRDKPDSVYCYPVFGGNGVTGWSDRYLLESPTIVLGRVGEYCGVVHRTPAKAWITDNALYASEFPEPIDLGFLFYVLTRLRLNSWKATTGQPKITQSEILNIRVAIPEDPGEQAGIAAKFNSVRQFINAKQTKIVALHRLKKSLMQNLLTGRIRLPVESTAKKGK